MVGQPAYFTSPEAFGLPQPSLAEQLATQGFLSPGMQGPGEEMFYGFSPEAQGLMGSSDNRMYAGQSITPELMRYMAQSWGGGRMSPDQLRQAFPEYLHSFMPQFDPTTSYRYDPGKVDKEGYESQAQYKYNYAQPIAAPKFQELPSIDIQKQMGLETEAEGAEWDRERRGMLRTGAGRNVFGAGRT
mgnify:CR=1 FL=1